MGYRKDDIERLIASLAGLPAVANVEVNKQEAVRLLAPTIKELQGRGYSVARIAALVSEHGVMITTTTLRSYLHRLKPTRKTSGKIAKKQAGSKGKILTTHAVDAAKSAPRETRGDTLVAVSVGTTNPRGGSGGASEVTGPVPSNGPTEDASEALTGAPPRRSVKSARTAPTHAVDAAKASFTPREDSDDI
jgi:hypothetical protein